jgi:hypothetical protein
MGNYRRQVIRTMLIHKNMLAKLEVGSKEHISKNIVF